MTEKRTYFPVRVNVIRSDGELKETAEFSAGTYATDNATRARRRVIAKT